MVANMRMVNTRRTQRIRYNSDKNIIHHLFYCGSISHTGFGIGLNLANLLSHDRTNDEIHHPH